MGEESDRLRRRGVAAGSGDWRTVRIRAGVGGLAEAATEPDGLTGGGGLEFGSLGISGVNDGLDFGSEAAYSLCLT